MDLGAGPAQAAVPAMDAAPPINPLSKCWVNSVSHGPLHGPKGMPEVGGRYNRVKGGQICW